MVAVAIGAINRSTASAVRAASLCALQTHRVRTGTLADNVESNGLSVDRNRRYHPTGDL